MNHFWKNVFFSTDPALPRPNVGEFGFCILFTAPRACGFICSPDLGGVDGLTGLGRLFLLENDESKLRGDDRVISDEVELDEKNEAAAAPALAGRQPLKLLDCGRAGPRQR